MALSQIEHRLGISQGTLYKRFPQECALVVAQYRIHCAERTEQRLRQNCEEVQRATFAVYSQGEKPTKRRVEAQLSDPSILAHPEVRAKWRAVREELERDLQ
jgi:AcrR family transcriptional regulator